MKLLTTLVVFFAVNTCFSQLYFAPRVDYTLPVTSTFVNYNHGDFNKDGNDDLIVSNFSNNTVSVFFGTGGGAFGPPQNLPVGTGPGGIFAYDVNDDGNLDILESNFSSNTTSVILGNGTGGFAPHVTFANGSGPQGPILGDYNEDGKIDAAIANFTGNTFSIALGNGDGTFTPTVAYATGTNPQVETADLNNDNHLDIVNYNSGGTTISVRLGTGTGTFGAATSYTTGSQPRVGVMRDFNKDGNMDVAVANRAGNSISVLMGTGTGLLNAPVNFPTTGPSAIIADDYNADGNIDLAVANTGSNTVSIYTGSGDGTFSLYQFTTVGSHPAFMRLIITDLNNDNNFDIVTSNDGTNIIGVLLGNVAPGGAGTAIRFNGTNQEAQLGTWFNHPDFTITMWVKPSAAQAANATIIDNNSTATRSWAFQQDGTTTNRYKFGGVAVDLLPDVWQHVALVFSGGVSTIYVNGCLSGTFNAGAINYDGTQNLRLGNFAGGGRNWAGSLDEVRIFNSAKTISEIQASINTEAPTATPSLGAYYRMNEGSGTNIYDGSANGRTGTLLNSPIFESASWGIPVPAIDNFTPVLGPVGTVVNLTGANFDPIPSNNQVMFNGVASIVSASTSTTITTAVPTGASTGKISVTVKCIATLSTTDFTVTNPLAITNQPGNLSSCDGLNATFTIVAAGTTNITYQWQRFNTTTSTFNNIANDGTYSGAASSALTINSVSSAVAGDYRCVVSGDMSLDATSDIGTLTVHPLPASPSTSDGSNCGPGQVTLSASGGSAGNYRWYPGASATSIPGAINDTYTTPALTATGNYRVSTVDAFCESTSVPVTAVIVTPPAAPAITSTVLPINNAVTVCSTTPLSLEAALGYDSYLWSNGATTNSIPVTASGVYSLTVTKDGCASPASGVLTVTVVAAPCTNSAPAIEPRVETTPAGSAFEIDLLTLITDPDNNLVLSTLSIVVQPKSGAIASIIGTTLHVDYDGVIFTGPDELTIRICDSFGACTTEVLRIEVIGAIAIFNAVSPNDDGLNDTFYIQYIDDLPDTRENHVAIFNRWGDLVWEGDNYDNTRVVFTGKTKNNADLPSGTYYYKLSFRNIPNPTTGYLQIKR